MIPEFLVHECFIYTVTSDFPRKVGKEGRRCKLSEIGRINVRHTGNPRERY